MSVVCQQVERDGWVSDGVRSGEKSTREAALSTVRKTIVARGSKNS